MENHDPGDEDRKPVISTYLDALGVADSLKVYRMIWGMVGSSPRADLTGRVIEENRDLWER